MPSTPGKLIFTNFLGLAPVGSTRTNIQFGEDYHLAKVQSVNTLASLGVLTPGLAPGTNVDSGAVVGNRVMKMITSDLASRQGVYLAEQGTKIHTCSGDGTMFNDAGFGTWPIVISATGSHSAHTSITLADFIISNGYLYASYNDNTDGDVARADGAGSVTANWFSTRTGGSALQHNVPHPLVVGENGFLYVADRNAIHKYDSVTDTVTLAAIDLPGEWVIYDMIPYKGYLWVLAIQEMFPGGVWPPSSSTNLSLRNAGVFLWNYQSRKSLEFSGFEKGTPYLFNNVSRANSIFLYQGMPHVFTLGSNKRTQLRRFTGSEFQIIWEEPGDILPVRGGITSYFNNILWADRNTGNLYTFGRMASNLPETFNMIGSAGAATGAIMLAPDSSIWGSYGTSSVKVFDGMATNASVTTITKQLTKLSRIERITVFYPPGSNTTANNTLTITAYKNFSSTAVGQTFSITHDATPGDLARGYQSFECGGETWSRTNALALKLDWSNSAGQTTTFTPYRIEVDYSTSDEQY